MKTIKILALSMAMMFSMSLLKVHAEENKDTEYAELNAKVLEAAKYAKSLCDMYNDIAKKYEIIAKIIENKDLERARSLCLLEHVFVLNQHTTVRFLDDVDKDILEAFEKIE